MSKKQYAEASAKSRRASRTIVTVLVMIIGVATGWVAGIGLNGKTNTAVATPESYSSPTDGPTELPSKVAQPPSQRTSGVAAASHPRPEAEQPSAASEPWPVERETTQGPPKPTKVDNGDEPESSTAGARAKDIRWQALEKILKDVERTRRGLANKNENEDHRK